MRTSTRVITAAVAVGMSIALVGCGDIKLGTGGNSYTAGRGTTKLHNISVTNLTSGVAKSAPKQTVKTRSYGRKLSITFEVTKLPGRLDRVTVAVKGAKPSSATLTLGQSQTFNLGNLPRKSSKAFTPKVTWKPAGVLGKRSKPGAVTLSGTATLK